MNSRIRLVSILLALAMISPALAQASGTLPAGAKILVVTDQSVSSKTAKIGQTISGTVSHNVMSGGTVVIPKGSEVKLTVSSVQASGRLSTPAKLYRRRRSGWSDYWSTGWGRQGRSDRGGGWGGSRNSRRGRDGKERHRVSCRNKAGLHHPGSSGDQLVRIAARESRARPKQPLLRQPRGVNPRLIITVPPPPVFCKCC